MGAAGSDGSWDTPCKFSHDFLITIASLFEHVKIFHSYRKKSSQAVCLTFLLAPFALDFAGKGMVYAMGRGGGKEGSTPAVSTQRVQTNYKIKEDDVVNDRIPTPVPEPGTIILAAAGLGGGLQFFERSLKSKHGSRKG